MGMRTASPWWASLLFGVGLLFLFVGERLFGHLPGTRMVMTGLGLVLVLGITGLRGYTMLATEGSRRNVERTLFYCQLGVVASLVIYLLTTPWGMAHLHFTEKGADHFGTALTVLWAIVMVVSLIPMFMIEISLGTALRNGLDLDSGSDEGIEYMRVRDVGLSGLTVGLALALLMVTCNVANDRNIQRDVSYFKTSSPGDSTKKIVAGQTENIKVLMFFPPSNEVAAQVRDYFSALSAASGHLTIEEHDRLGDAEIAGKYKISKDGVVVFVKGTGDKEKSQTIELDTDIEKARKSAQGNKLRNFDREVNSSLLKLVREKRKAYLVAGHGEITSWDTVPPQFKNGDIQERHVSVFKSRMAQLNYEVKDLGPIDLQRGVPDDATIVMLLAPTISLADNEWDGINKYLDKGGRLLVAMEPKGDPSLGSLGSKLGVKFNPLPLTDDQVFLNQRGTKSEHRFVATTQFSAHASTTSLSRAAKGLVLVGAGSLEDAPVIGKDTPKKTVTIRSMDSSFLDVIDNDTFDAGSEKRQRYTEAEAFEGPKLKSDDGKDKDGWRALVFADADLFADALVQNAQGRPGVLMIAQLFGGDILDDSVKWLGGEEVFAGEVVSEDDKAIQHTKSQDAVWFTLTIVGMPLIVLALGLVGTWARRRKKATTEVTK